MNTAEACRNPTDDKLLNVVFAGKADAIIIDDADLLALDPFHGVTIISQARFLSQA